MLKQTSFVVLFFLSKDICVKYNKQLTRSAWACIQEARRPTNRLPKREGKSFSALFPIYMLGHGWCTRVSITIVTEASLRNFSLFNSPCAFSSLPHHIQTNIVMLVLLILLC